MIDILESIFLTLFLLSGLGLVFLVWRKIPVLASLQVKEQKREGLKEKIKLKILKILDQQKISFEKWLEKFLMKVRIFALKTDYKTWHWLRKIKEKKQKSKEVFNDNYWEKIKNKKE